MANPRTPRDPETGAFRKREPSDDQLLGPLPLTDEDEPAELAPPRSMPNPRVSRPPPPPSDPGALREMYDGEQLEPGELAMRQQRARQLEAIRANPFIGSFDESGFPKVPEDDPNWSYLWMRHTLPGGGGERAEIDTKNIGMKINGGLRYEYVRLGDLPEEWQPRFGLYRGKVTGIEGAGLLVYKDTVLCRTDRFLRDQKQEANDYYARLQRKQIRDNPLEGDAADRGYLSRKHMDRRDERFLTPEDQGGVRESYQEGLSDQVGSPTGGKGF
jgi:hypothetical protein